MQQDWIAYNVACMTIDLRSSADLSILTGVATLILHSPPDGLMNQALIGRIDAALDRVEIAITEGKVGAVVLRGAASAAFVRHHDVREIAMADDGYAASGQVHALYNRLAALTVPSIAAIDGACMGAGLELALACTLRYAGRDAGPFGFPEITIGICPGGGGTQRAPRAIGADAALELMLTGRLFDAAEALRLGLVHGLSDDVTEHAAKVAARLASRAPQAVAAIRRLSGMAEAGGLAEGCAAERDAFAALLAGPDTRARIAALAAAGFPVVR